MGLLKAAESKCSVGGGETQRERERERERKEEGE